MYCPECGHDAGDAKFCPECGADLSRVKNALKGKTTGGQGGASRQAGAGSRQAAPSKTAAAAEAAKPAGRGLSPAVIWGAFGAIAVIVVIVVIMASGGFGGDDTGGAAVQGQQSVQPVTADTSGSYRELVNRANDLYDKGTAAMTNGIPSDQSAQYFSAAAKVYQAAWTKESGDSAVGTDWAVALFYSGDVDGAIKQVDVVLKADPKFQQGLFNKGIFLSHKARFAKGTAEAKKYIASARAAFTAAVAIDPQSDIGKQADSAIQSLNQTQ